MYIKIPVVRARGGAEVALGSYYKAFLIYRTCMRRTPARPVRACFVRSCCKVVVQEHDQRGTPAQCNEKRTLSSHFTLRSSHLALHTSHMHFTLHTSSHLKSCELFSHHLTSSQLFSSRPISSHMSFKQVLLNRFHLVQALINLSHLPEVLLNSSQLFCAPERSYCQRSLLHKKNIGRRKLLHIEALRHRCIYTEKPFKHTLYYKA